MFVRRIISELGTEVLEIYSVFGISETQLFDALPPDAPFACPPAGTPQFTGVAVEVIEQYCYDYSVAEEAGRQRRDPPRVGGRPIRRRARAAPHA